MAVAYENARSLLGEKCVWEYTTESGKIAIFAELLKVEQNKTDEGNSTVLTLKSAADEELLKWDAANARPVVAKETKETKDVPEAPEDPEATE